MKKIILIMMLLSVLNLDVNARRPDSVSTKYCAFHGVVYHEHTNIGQTPNSQLLCPAAPRSLIDQIDGGIPKHDRPHDEECYSWWYR